MTIFQSTYNAVECSSVIQKRQGESSSLGGYEASELGSPYIESEHLLLGLLREDKVLTNRFLGSLDSVESIRKQIEGHTTIHEKIPTSVDLPLSNECKRVLAYAAEEAKRLRHKHIGTEHLLLGLLREEKCFTAEILYERGLRLSTIREELASGSQGESPAAASVGRLHYSMGAIGQLPLFVLLAVGVAKSGMSGRHLLVIAVLWFVAVAVPTWLTRGRSFSLLWSFGKRNRFVAAACTYGFLLVYQLFVIGWVIPLGVGIYRLTTR